MANRCALTKLDGSSLNTAEASELVLDLSRRLVDLVPVPSTVSTRPLDGKGNRCGILCSCNTVHMEPSCGPALEALSLTRKPLSLFEVL